MVKKEDQSIIGYRSWILESIRNIKLLNLKAQIVQFIHKIKIMIKIRIKNQNQNQDYDKDEDEHKHKHIQTHVHTNVNKVRHPSSLSFGVHQGSPVPSSHRWIPAVCWPFSATCSWVDSYTIGCTWETQETRRIDSPTDHSRLRCIESGTVVGTLTDQVQHVIMSAVPTADARFGQTSRPHKSFRERLFHDTNKLAHHCPKLSASVSTWQHGRWVLLLPMPSSLLSTSRHHSLRSAKWQVARTSTVDRR